jgi:CRISPR-associated endonuclease/helicase Cas3
MRGHLINFADAFEQLTGHGPFPWQQRLYEHLIKADLPSSCDLPTGLGKTAVIPIWMIALANRPDCIPHRLIYVVNRRTVVDQTTDEVVKLRKVLNAIATSSPLRQKLEVLGVSTLRGQFADNREWSANPSRPAVVIGTVDMIGSRLLFNGYGAGFRTRPLYAGLLGQDALLVHDEAHLEPAFQQLIEKIQDEQNNEASLGDRFRLRVLEMSATPRGNGDTIKLDDADLATGEIRKRINAKKRIHLIANADAKKLADQIADLARDRFGASGRAILIFVRKVEDVEKIAKKLPQDRTRQLTGTLRGMERDQLVEHSVFKRFLPGAEASEQTMYLVCTSAGEVGVNISADHLICDLSTFDSMTQRLGRVNRFGLGDDTEVHLFHPSKFDQSDELDARLSKSLVLLRELKGDGSPSAISRLDRNKRTEAFAPPPTILPVSDILFDAWALTSIRGEIPGRPKVEPYLHGMSDIEPPQTHVAWREEVGKIRGHLLNQHPPRDLLEDYPLKPQELLRDRSDRVFKHLDARAKMRPEDIVWIVDDEGNVEVTPLAELAEGDEERIEYRTVLMAPTTGGLRIDGMLDGACDDEASDVSNRELVNAMGSQRRIRVWDNDKQRDEKTKGMRLIRRIDFRPTEESDEEADVRSWYWFERPAGGDSDGSRSAPDPLLWDDHTRDVVHNVKRFITDLPLSPDLKKALLLAARFHDLGKKREHWQRSIGNSSEVPPWYAKSGKNWQPRDFTSYRHEFGSLLDMPAHEEFKALANQPQMQDLILHLVAAHHGFARPHFPPECAVDSPDHSTVVCEKMAREVLQRFARLQRRYGRWGLAYLEGILRAADYYASAHPGLEGDQP